MNTTKEENSRRDFLKKCGLSTASLLLPVAGLHAIPSVGSTNKPSTSPKTPVNFIYDDLAFSPQEYLEKLNEINKKKPIESDFYGNGGATQLLEAEFAKITGKEKAIFLPTGTMANQLAIKLLSEANTKVIVPENSHVFRDEADAAQSVHSKRLIPVGKGKPYFDLADLKTEIDYTTNNEVFKSGLGTVVIENPVRRADGTFVPLEVIKDISNYCKANNYRMHLDGARIHIAAAFSKISVQAYASYFDTVYISLYKYLNADGGAILCGEAKLIDQLAHHIKILGGTVFQSWSTTAMALHYLEGITECWSEVVTKAEKLIAALNQLKGITITGLTNGTNIFDFTLSPDFSLKKLAVFLHNEHNIWLGRANDKGIVKFTVNESLLSRDNKEIVDAWKKGMEQARN